MWQLLSGAFSPLVQIIVGVLASVLKFWVSQPKETVKVVYAASQLPEGSVYKPTRRDLLRKWSGVLDKDTN